MDLQVSRKAKRELTWILCFLISLPLLYILVYGNAGYLQLRKHRQELQVLHRQNLLLRQQQDNLIEKIERLQNDPYEMERIARERYNFARPGDIILNIPE